MSRNPVPEDLRQQLSVTKVVNARLSTYPLLRFVARLKKTKNSNANGRFVAKGAYLLHVLRNGVCRECGPRPCYKPLVSTRSHMSVYVYVYA